MKLKKRSHKLPPEVTDYVKDMVDEEFELQYVGEYQSESRYVVEYKIKDLDIGFPILIQYGGGDDFNIIHDFSSLSILSKCKKRFDQKIVSFFGKCLMALRPPGKAK